MMDKIKTDKTTLSKFGLMLALALALFCLAALIKQKHPQAWVAIISACLMLVAIVAPVLLKYFYIFWMKLAYFLSWINTRLLLGIIFYLVFSPVGLLMRLFKIDPLERNLKYSKESYWKTRLSEESSPVDYHRQS